MADKIAITVPEELLREVESLRRTTKESRSAVFARGARMLVRAQERRKQAERYVEAYRERPETEAEVAVMEALARSSLAAVEWKE